MFALQLQTRGEEHTVRLDLVKQHLGVYIDLDDELLQRQYIAAAEDWAAAFCRRPIQRHTWRQIQSEIDFIERHRQFRLRGFVSTVTSVEYRDDNGTFQTEATAVYESLIGDDYTYLREAPNESWSDPGDYNDAWRVTFDAGWIESDAPPWVQQAVTLKVEHLFDGNADAETAAERILQPYVLPPW